MTNLNPVTLEAHYQRYLRVLGVKYEHDHANRICFYGPKGDWWPVRIVIQPASRPVWLAMSLHWLAEPQSEEIDAVRAALSQRAAIYDDIGKFLPNWEAWECDEQTWCVCRYNRRGHELGVLGCVFHDWGHQGRQFLCERCRKPCFYELRREFKSGLAVSDCCGDTVLKPSGIELESTDVL